MKHILLLTTLTLTSLVQAQFYFSAGSGYSFGIAKQTMDGLNFENSEYNVVTPSGSIRDQIYVSLGEGFTSTATIGYQCIPGLSVELGGSYTLGKEYNSTIKYNEFEVGSDIYLTRKQSLLANSWIFGPAIKYLIPLNKFELYARFQFLFLSSSIQYSKEDEPSPSYTGVDGWKDYSITNFGGLSYGAGASIGCAFSLNEHWQLFAEGKINSISYAPTKGIYTYYGSNGVNEVDNMTYWQRNIEYTNHLDPVEYPVDENTAQKRLRTSYPISSFGLQLGITFWLGK